MDRQMGSTIITLDIVMCDSWYISTILDNGKVMDKGQAISYNHDDTVHWVYLCSNMPVLIIYFCMKLNKYNEYLVSTVGTDGLVF